VYKRQALMLGKSPPVRPWNYRGQPIIGTWKIRIIHPQKAMLDRLLPWPFV